MENGVTDSFKVFMKESGNLGKDYMHMVLKQAEASALDEKTRELAYIAVLSAIRMIGGLKLHVTSAKKAGATREEVKSAVLVGFPAVGLSLIDALEFALRVYDEV